MAFGYLGGVGPGVAALIVLRVCHGQHGIRRLARSLLAWRVPLRWYAIALLGPAAVWAAVAALGDGFGGWSLTMAPMFLLYVVQAVSEEAGWRGFALAPPAAPRCADRQPRPRRAVGALAPAAAADRRDGHGHLPHRPYMLEIMAIAVIYTWLYNASLVIPILFHAGLEHPPCVQHLKGGSHRGHRDPARGPVRPPAAGVPIRI